MRKFIHRIIIFICVVSIVDLAVAGLQAILPVSAPPSYSTRITLHTIVYTLYQLATNLSALSSVALHFSIAYAISYERFSLLYEMLAPLPPFHINPSVDKRNRSVEWGCFLVMLIATTSIMEVIGILPVGVIYHKLGIPGIGSYLLYIIPSYLGLIATGFGIFFYVKVGRFVTPPTPPAP